MIDKSVNPLYNKGNQGRNPMAMNKYDESVRKMADGFGEMFAEEVASDERFHELLMTIAEEFVAREIPIVSEDSATDLAMELMMRCTARKV